LNFSVDYPSSEPESDSADSDSELSDISKSSEVVYVVSPKRKEKTTPSPGSPCVGSPPNQRDCSALAMLLYSDSESDGGGNNTSFSGELDDSDQEIIGNAAGISPQGTNLGTQKDPYVMKPDMTLKSFLSNFQHPTTNIRNIWLGHFHL